MQTLKILRRRIFLVLILVLSIFFSCNKPEYSFSELNPGVTLDYVGEEESTNSETTRDDGEGDNNEVSHSNVPGIQGGLLLPGYLRGELSWNRPEENIVSFKIEWGEEGKEIVGEYSIYEGPRVEVLIEDLEEKLYRFEITQFDENGEVSDKVNIQGKIYGPDYRSSLKIRPIKESEEVGENKLEIVWGTQVGNTSIFSELKFTNIEGEEETVKIENESSTSIENIDLSNLNLMVRSAYLPEPNVIDTFYTDFIVPDLNPWILSFNSNMRSSVDVSTAAAFHVLVSNDFDGVYEVDHVNSATWVEIASSVNPNGFTFSEGGGETGDFVESGEKSISQYLVPGEPFYLAFQLTFRPAEGDKNISWSFNYDLIGLRTQNDNKVLSFSQSDFHGVVDAEDTNRDLVVLFATSGTLRGNSNADGFRDMPITAWAITEKIN